MAIKAKGNAGNAVKILLMAYRIMRSRGKNVMEISDVNKAVGLMGGK